MNVKLYTRDGGFVTDITTIPFRLMPEVIQWGSRFFCRNVFKDTTTTYGYTEGCLWFHIDPIARKEQSDVPVVS